MRWRWSYTSAISCGSAPWSPPRMRCSSSVTSDRPLFSTEFLMGSAAMARWRHILRSIPSRRVLEELLCEGNACDVVAIVWDGVAGHFWVRNTSRRRVIVIVQTWPNVSKFVLEPGDAHALLVGTFE